MEGGILVFLDERKLPPPKAECLGELINRMVPILTFVGYLDGYLCLKVEIQCIQNLGLRI